MQRNQALVFGAEVLAIGAILFTIRGFAFQQSARDIRNDIFIAWMFIATAAVLAQKVGMDASRRSWFDFGFMVSGLIMVIVDVWCATQGVLVGGWWTVGFHTLIAGLICFTILKDFARARQAKLIAQQREPSADCDAH